MDLIERIDSREIHAPAAFDYASLPADLAAEARAVADKVRKRHARTMKLILETGRDLLSIKNRLEHGQFGDWVEAEFPGEARTAQNYMSAAEAFAGKYETVSYLPPTVVYKLSAPSTPEHVREDVVKRIEAGEKIKPTAIETMVRDARETDRKTKAEQKRAASLAKMTPEERKKAEQKEKRQRRTAEQRQQEMEEGHRRFETEQAAQLDAAIEAVSLLQSRLTEQEIGQLARLVEAANHTFNRLLRDTAGLKVSGYSEGEWINKAKARASQSAAA